MAEEVVIDIGDGYKYTGSSQPGTEGAGYLWVIKRWKPVQESMVTISSNDLLSAVRIAVGRQAWE